jgi:flagellin-like protein
MNKKRGISAVVATVLIILITVAAVTIIWAAIIPMIKNQLEEGTVCLDATTALMVENKGFTCFDGANVKVQVSHGSKDVGLSGIQFLISEAGDTTSEEVTTNLPTPNGERVITVAYAGTPDSVAVAPIVTVGNSDTTCEASAPVMLEAC